MSALEVKAEFGPPPIEVEAELGGKKRKLLLSMLGLYKAVTEYDYGNEKIDLAEMLKQIQDEQQAIAEGKPPPEMVVTAGQLFKKRLEEVWLAVLHYEDISKEDFLGSLHAHDMGKITDIWRRLAARQKEQPGEKITTDNAEGGKKKRGAKSSSNG